MWAGVATGSVLIPGTVYFTVGSVKRYAALLIERQLGYLKLEPGSINKYVNDYFKDDTNKASERIKWKTFYYMDMNWEKSDHILELIKYFLLSSDFFINKMDESKTIHYLGLYSPYKSPIPNPFSYILYPPNEIKEA
jgi:hypothetical protein